MANSILSTNNGNNQDNTSNYGIGINYTPSQPTPVNFGATDVAAAGYGDGTNSYNQANTTMVGNGINSLTNWATGGTNGSTIGNGINSLFSGSSGSGTGSAGAGAKGSGGNYGFGPIGSLWGMAMDGANTGFSIYSGIKQMNLAKKAFDFNKAVATQNLNNDVQKYNTGLQTVAGLRSSFDATGGPGSQAANDYYNQNKLKGI